MRDIEKRSFQESSGNAELHSMNQIGFAASGAPGDFDKLARIATELNQFLAARSEETVSARSERFVLETISRVRELRTRFFPSKTFGDPAWDMFLELKRSEMTGTPVIVSDLCNASTIPNTTALRWITKLVERGLLVRTDDPLDGRRVIISLSRAASEALSRFLTDAGAVMTKGNTVANR
jgi:hypothetical protein